jgi:4-alpha-glucanotransferase
VPASPAHAAPDLAALAAAHGVATSYEDSSERRHEVDAQIVVDVLGLLGVDATSPAAVAESLAATRGTADRDQLPPTLVVRAGTPEPPG